jgi:hypothetical protein
VWLRENNLWEIVITRTTTDITGVCLGVFGIDFLDVRGVGLRHLGRHLVYVCGLGRVESSEEEEEYQVQKPQSISLWKNEGG